VDVCLCNRRDRLPDALSPVSIGAVGNRDRFAQVQCSVLVSHTGALARCGWQTKPENRLNGNDILNSPIEWLCHSDARQVSDLPLRAFFFDGSATRPGRRPSY
jgi:hypothetical protein